LAVGVLDSLPMESVLFISKPVAPPWNDSSKNLVKDLAQTTTRFRCRVLTPRGYRLPGEQVLSEELYQGGGRFTPALVQNLRVLGRLLRGDDSAVTHFFFAPNPRTAAAARLALALRRRRTVQTVCSTPQSWDGAAGLLFADRVVVLSEHSRRSFVEAGAPADRLRLIPPGIRIPPPPDPAARAAIRRELGVAPEQPLVIYPGDYQFSSAADTLARAVLQLGEAVPATFVFACRIKQQASLAEEARIRAQLASGGALPRVRFLREVPDMLRLLGACDLCVLPAESLYAKMDLPLVLIEAMALGLPLIVADRPPLCELLVGGGGEQVPPADPAALAAALRRLLTDQDARRRLGEEARRAALQRFRIEGVTRQHEDLYLEMIEA
jgi:glycosyltransferase involved in cell wall biosynthesis